jgi:hypothetical protein
MEFLKKDMFSVADVPSALAVRPYILHELPPQWCNYVTRHHFGDDAARADSERAHDGHREADIFSFEH